MRSLQNQGKCWQIQACRLFAIAIFIISTQGHAADTPPDGSEELQRQQQRERALRQQQETAPDVRLERATAPETGRLPKDETPCFVIDRLLLKGEGAERFQWALKSAAGDHDSPLGQCLGSAGINLVMKRLQNAIIERGYITTRVLAVVIGDRPQFSEEKIRGLSPVIRYRDGGIADPSKPMSFVGPWSSTAELTSVQANAQVVSKLPPGSTITGRINADLENAKAIADGWQAPFVPGTQVLEITTSQATQYVRVFGGDSRQVGSWVMRAEDVQGLTPEQIASKFSLPQVPNMIGDVTIPAGTRLNVSAANGISPNASKGVYTGDNVGGGGVQFQIIGRPMDPMEFSSWFSNPRGLK